MTSEWILAVQLCSTLFMCGLIWFVQIVHYPLFAEVGRDFFVEYERRHQQRTSYVVIPGMVAELVSSVLWLEVCPAALEGWAALGLGLVVMIWLSTFGLQVPAHRQLAIEFSPLAHRTLVLTNWLRTIAWTLRSGLVLWMAAPQAGKLTFAG